MKKFIDLLGVPLLTGLSIVLEEIAAGYNDAMSRGSVYLIRKSTEKVASMTFPTEVMAMPPVRELLMRQINSARENAGDVERWVLILPFQHEGKESLFLTIGDNQNNQVATIRSVLRGEAGNFISFGDEVLPEDQRIIGNPQMTPARHLN